MPAAVARTSAAAITPSTPCAASAAASAPRSARPSARSPPASVRARDASCRPSSLSSSPGLFGSASLAATTVSMPPPDSKVSRMIASGPRTARTSRSAPGIVRAVKRLIFIEGHHTEGSNPHAAGDFGRRDDRERRQVAFTQPPEMETKTRRAEQDGLELLGGKALAPVGEPADQALGRAGIAGELAACIPRCAAEQGALERRGEGEERDAAVGRDQAARDRAAERLARMLRQHVGVLVLRRLIGERLEHAAEVADGDALAQEVLQDLLHAADGKLLRHELLDDF